MCLFDCFCLFLWGDRMWMFLERRIQHFSPHAAICMLFMKIKIVRGLANNEIIRTVEFITTLCKLLLSSIIIWLLIVVQGHIVLHI